MGADVVVAQIREQHAEGREHARRAGDDDVADADLARDRDRVQRTRAAIGDQREIAGVEAALGGDALHRVGHGGRGDAQDAVGGLRRAHAERLAHFGQRALGGLDVELHLAAEEAVGAEPAEHEVGVGHGRLLAAEAVAGRARLRARALRTDPQGAVVDAGDRAAAGADLENIHHGDLHRQRLVVAADQRRAGGQRLALVDDAGLRRGAAHVEGDGVLDAERVAERLGADHARRRPRFQHAHALRSAPARSRRGRRSIARSGTSRGSRPCGYGRRSRRRIGAPSARYRRWRRPSSSARTRDTPATARARPRRTCRDGACSAAPWPAPRARRWRSS